MPRRLRLLVLGALLALVPILAACGQGGAQATGGPSAQQVLAQAFAGASQVRSGQLDLVVRVQPRGGDATPLLLRVTGPFARRGPRELPRLDLNLDLRARGQRLAAGLTFTGRHAFVQVLGTPYRVPDGYVQQLLAQARAASSGRAGAAPSLPALGIDPMAWLRDPRVVGQEEVAGTRTDHVTAGVDVPRLLADLDRLRGALGAAAQPLTPAERDQVAHAVRSARLDVFSGARDHVLRRLRLTADVAGLDAQALGGARAATLDLTLQLTDVNAPVRIAAPAGARPFGQLLQAFGALGGLGGRPGASAEGARLSRYTRCLSRAGGDRARAAACERLLG
jgi:hypothetical protein